MYKFSTLPNGLRVASETLPGLETVAVCVTVDVGARHESGSECGISHLLEHMAFKGTSRRSAKQIAEAFDDIGGQSNAYTSLEATVYYARVLKNDLPVATDIIADILQHSTFDAEELTREQQVVLQEIAMHQDSPDDLVFDYFHDTAFSGQPLGRSILGTPEQVSSYARQDLMRYMERHYHAPSMVLSAAGNIAHDELLELAQKHFAGVNRSEAPKAEPGIYKGGDFRQAKKLEQLHVVLGFKSVSIHDPAYRTLQLLSTILGGGMSSRLFQEVREKRGLCYGIQAFLTSYRDCGIFGIYTATGESQAKDVMPVIAGELRKAQGTITETELARAKNQLKSSLLMARESSSSIAEWIGRHLTNYGRYKSAKEISETVDAVTLEDLHGALQTLLTPGPITFCSLGPQGKLTSYEELTERLAA